MQPQARAVQQQQRVPVYRPSGHTCCAIPAGFYLANRGHDLRLIQDYLGNRDPKHTVHYTRTSGSRFKGLLR